MCFRVVLVSSQVDLYAYRVVDRWAPAALTSRPSATKYRVESGRGDDHGSNRGLKGACVGRGEQNNQTESFNLDGPSAEGATSGAEPSEEALERPTR